MNTIIISAPQDIGLDLSRAISELISTMYAPEQFSLDVTVSGVGETCIFQISHTAAADAGVGVEVVPTDDVPFEEIVDEAPTAIELPVVSGGPSEEMPSIEEPEEPAQEPPAPVRGECLIPSLANNVAVDFEVVDAPVSTLCVRGTSIGDEYVEFLFNDCKYKYPLSSLDANTAKADNAGSSEPGSICVLMRIADESHRVVLQVVDSQEENAIVRIGQDLVHIVQT